MEQAAKPVRDRGSIRKNRPCYRYGNYLTYYGYRVGAEMEDDPRLKLFQAEWFHGKRMVRHSLSLDRLLSINSAGVNSQPPHATRRWTSAATPGWSRCAPALASCARPWWAWTSTARWCRRPSALCAPRETRWRTGTRQAPASPPSCRVRRCPNCSLVRWPPNLYGRLSLSLSFGKVPQLFLRTNGAQHMGRNVEAMVHAHAHAAEGGGAGWSGAHVHATWTPAAALQSLRKVTFTHANFVEDTHECKAASADTVMWCAPPHTTAQATRSRRSS